MRVVLVSTYDLGRQPFGLASPAAWLREAGAEVVCVDLSRSPLPEAAVRAADLVAFHLPMHTATRLALPVIDRVRALNPRARICCYGLYAPPNRALLESRGVEIVLGGEFEADLLAAVGFGTPAGPAETPPAVRESSIDTGHEVAAERRPGGVQASGTRPPLPRLRFRVPDRTGLPPLDRYAALRLPGGARRTVGHTEASRGCKHLCRHCPVVPIYEGRFRIVPVDVVLADIRAQVAAGAEHITFGDPDFFNGPRHAVAVVTALAREWPRLTYDVTIKIEHLVRHASLLPLLRETGCVLVTSAAESIDDEVLAKLAKGHTRADIERAVALCRDAGLALAPTFVAFTPWTTLGGYCELLRFVAEQDLVEQVAPIQLALRLLIPEGSRLLELDDVRRLLGPFDPEALVHPWVHPDPEVDRLQEDIQALVGAQPDAPRAHVFAEVWRLAHERARIAAPPLPRAVLVDRAAVPYLTEPWYC
ncbi:MAG TPA: CUAEP/CCAEP-tail radical SAM protein [Vicinamibacterales bacterium]|nr:CUAEP/CCAEP-tail radical SAM protein [Vicinamibacterales bacterium]